MVFAADTFLEDLGKILMFPFSVKHWSCNRFLLLWKKDDENAWVVWLCSGWRFFLTIQMWPASPEPERPHRAKGRS